MDYTRFIENFRKNNEQESIEIQKITEAKIIEEQRQKELNTLIRTSKKVTGEK